MTEETRNPMGNYKCPICNPTADPNQHKFSNYCDDHASEQASHLNWEINFQPNFEELERMTAQYKRGIITGKELVQRTAEWVNTLCRHTLYRH